VSTMESPQTVTQNQFVKAFGHPKERAVAKVKNLMSDQVQAYIAQSSLVVMATSSGSGHCDASPKGGKPGFVKILDDQHLIVPDVAGNKLFQSYLNMLENPHIGLLFLIPGSNDTVRVNGRVSLLSAEELGALNIKLSLNNPDDNSIQLQGVLVEVEEAYTHCPRAFKFADLWNVEKVKRP